MKFRRRNAPLILLLVPFASALSAAAQDNIQSTLTTKSSEPRDAAKLDPNPSPIVDIAKGKYDVGTKDAPVDGKDGKPHAGPFVGSEKDPKKPKAEDSEIVLGKEDLSELVTIDGSKIPAVNDGVMNDPSRELPKQGTTGTEGGVSEKDKARKAQEGQTGEKVEKKPDSPKEAPPLPLSEESKQTKGEKAKAKEVDDEDEDADSLAGLEVLQLSYFTLGL
jgi:hypothetical protein